MQAQVVVCVTETRDFPLVRKRQGYLVTIALKYKDETAAAVRKDFTVKCEYGTKIRTRNSATAIMGTKMKCRYSCSIHKHTSTLART